MASRITTGCLPYKDGSGFEVTIRVEGPNAYFDHDRVVLNPDRDFTDFPADKWPEVRAAIDRAVEARAVLDNEEV